MLKGLSKSNNAKRFKAMPFMKGDADTKLKALGSLGMIGAAGVVGAEAINENVAQPMIQSAQIARSKRKMLELTPSLKNEDAKDVSNYFNVIKKFSPKAASNPLVAGALVNKMVQFGGVDHKLIQDLTSIQKDSFVKRDDAIKKEVAKKVMFGIGDL